MATAQLEAPKAAPSFYETDETGWLEEMARIIAAGRFDEIDYLHLEEYLADMAKRDRREAFSRLRILVTHWLKWEFQPDRRSKSWQLTILAQRRTLEYILDSATLTNHARDILETLYARAVADAVEETGLPLTAFPASNPRSLEEWLALSFA